MNDKINNIPGLTIATHHSLLFTSALCSNPLRVDLYLNPGYFRIIKSSIEPQRVKDTNTGQESPKHTEKCFKIPIRFEMDMLQCIGKGSRGLIYRVTATEALYVEEMEGKKLHYNIIDIFTFSLRGSCVYKLTIVFIFRWSGPLCIFQ